MENSTNFISSKHNEEEHVKHSKSDNKEIKINDKAQKVIGKLFKSRLNRYQNHLQNLREVVILSLISFIYCIIDVIKEIQILVDHIQILLIG